MDARWRFRTRQDKHTAHDNNIHTRTHTTRPSYRDDTDMSIKKKKKGTSDHLGAIGDGLLTVECALRAGEPLADHTCVLVHSGWRARAHKATVGRLLGNRPSNIAESTHSAYTQQNTHALSLAPSRVRERDCDSSQDKWEAQSALDLGGRAVARLHCSTCLFTQVCTPICGIFVDTYVVSCMHACECACM